MAGFMISGFVSALERHSEGDDVRVTCKLEFSLATHPEEGIFGFLKGGGFTNSSDFGGDVELAEQECVAGVIENLMTTKVIPTLESSKAAK